MATLPQWNCFLKLKQQKQSGLAWDFKDTILGIKTLWGNRNVKRSGGELEVQNACYKTGSWGKKKEKVKIWGLVFLRYWYSVSVEALLPLLGGRKRVVNI